MSTYVLLFLYSLLPHPLALQCQDLPVPNEAQVNCSHPFGAFRYQSVCSFTCNEDLLLVGASVLQCLATGNWNSVPPECQGKNIFFLTSWKSIVGSIFKGWILEVTTVRSTLKWTGKLINTLIVLSYNPRIPNENASGG